MKTLRWIVSLTALCLLCGCGYTMGSVAHPQFKSIAVAEAVNETVEPNASYLIRQHCAEEFMVDGSLKLLEKSQADLVLYTRILNVYSEKIAGASTNSDITFRPRAWRVTAEVEYTLILPGRTTPIFTKQAVGRSTYQVLFDQETHRRNAVEAALREAARSIVRQTVEGW